jgi:lysophospholipase L1-like esterase
MRLSPADRYVALGSSFAAGPGLRPRVKGSPFAAGRSTINYAHLVASELSLSLRDVTFSGATAAGILQRGQGGEAPQIDAVDGSARLITVTCGGNDVLFIPGITSAALPRPLRRLPAIRRTLETYLDPVATATRLDAVGDSIRRLAAELRNRAPDARVLFIDYLTVVPPDDGFPAPPLPPDILTAARSLADGLAATTRGSATAEGCEVVAASEASRDHHAWSPQPWTRGAGLSLRAAAPFHPTAAGMRAVAELVTTRLRAERA